jgi:hypothetical protein
MPQVETVDAIPDRPDDDRRAPTLPGADLTLPTLPVLDCLDSDCTPTAPDGRMFAQAVEAIQVSSFDAAGQSVQSQAALAPATAAAAAPDTGSAGPTSESPGGPTAESWLNRTSNRMMRFAAAADPMRRFTQTLSQRSSIGWQRTILLVVGGAFLAFGVNGGWRRGGSESPATAGPSDASHSASVGTEIQRMTRAPLRVEPAATSSERPSNDPIFRMPVMSREDVRPRPASTDAAPVAQPAIDPAAPPVASEPSSEFPRMAAPDGSAVTRRGQPPAESLARARPAEPERPSNGQTPPGWSPHPGGDAAAQSPATRPRETLAETQWDNADEPVARELDVRAPHRSPYPHTDPATYRDPVYEVPVIANRPQDAAH